MHTAYIMKGNGYRTLLPFVLLISCDDSIGDTDNSSSSSNLRSILPGLWAITHDGWDETDDISVNGNSVKFLGQSYNGSFTSSKFTGSANYSYYVRNIVINRVSNISISGYTSETYMGQEQDRENFTAQKVQ